jgi:hypothetical protein
VSRVEAELLVDRTLQGFERRVLRYVGTLVAQEVLELSPARCRETPRIRREVPRPPKRGLPEPSSGGIPVGAAPGATDAPNPQAPNVKRR